MTPLLRVRARPTSLVAGSASESFTARSGGIAGSVPCTSDHVPSLHDGHALRATASRRAGAGRRHTALSGARRAPFRESLHDKQTRR